MPNPTQTPPASTQPTSTTPPTDQNSHNLSQLDQLPLAPKTTLENLSQIKKKTTSLLIICIITTSILSLIAVILIILINNKSTQFNLINQQLAAKQQDNQSLDVALSFLSSNKPKIDLILNTLPNETRLIDFIDSIESLSAAYSSQHSLEFSALAPTGSGNHKYIPIIMKLSTDKSNFELFLAGLEKLPYIIEVTNIEIKTPSNSSISDYTLAIRIYVQNPFKSE